MERATFDDILRLKLRREALQTETAEIEIPSLGKTLTFHAPTRDQQLDFIDKARQGGGDIAASYPAYRQLIYDSCEMLHSDAVQEGNSGDPRDIVDQLFTPVEAMELGDKIADRFMTVGKDIKN